MKRAFGIFIFPIIYIYIFQIQWGAVQSYLEFPNHLMVMDHTGGQLMMIMEDANG